MKKLTIALFFLFSANGMAFASCNNIQELKVKEAALTKEANELNSLATYMSSLFNERDGKYEGNRTVGMLLLDSRTGALDVQMKAAALRIQISECSL